MSLGRSELKAKAPGGPFSIGIWAAAAAAAAVIAVGPASALWNLSEYHRSPGARRVEATLMSSRASRAFDSARTAINALVAARTSKDWHGASSALKTSRREFSRDMAKAAETSVIRRAEILGLKREGETIIGSACGPWTEAFASVTPGKGPKAAAAAHSGLSYFKTCLTATTRFQQALDDQTATIVADMTRASATVMPSPRRPTPAPSPTT